MWLFWNWTAGPIVEVLPLDVALAVARLTDATLRPLVIVSESLALLALHCYDSPLKKALVVTQWVTISPLNVGGCPGVRRIEQSPTAGFSPATPLKR